MKVFSVKELFGAAFPPEANEVARLAASLIFEYQNSLEFIAQDANTARAKILSESDARLFASWENSTDDAERALAKAETGMRRKIRQFLNEQEAARLGRVAADYLNAKAAYIEGAFASSGVPCERADRIIAEIKAERAAQDAQWGGADHDDRHGMEEFAEFIDGQLTKCAHGRSPNSRERFIKIAALALAAVESHDRKAVAYASQVHDAVLGED